MGAPKKHEYRHLPRLHDIESPPPRHHVRRDRRAAVPSPDHDYEHPPSFCRLFCTCFLWSLLATVLVFMLLVLAVLFLYLSYLPRLPQFHLEHLGLVGLSRDSLSSGRLEASVHVSIAAANDNGRLRFGLEEFQVWVYSDGGVELGNSTVPGTFQLSEKGASAVQAEVRVSKHVVPDLVHAKALLRRIKDNRLVAAVHWGGAVEVAVKNWSLGKYRVRVACENIDMVKKNEVENEQQPICPIFLFGWIPLSRYLP